MDYIVAGAPQSGTTWTHLCLEEHPECFVTKPKEIHFFDWHYEKGKEWYYEHFEEASDEQVKLDICPHYMYTENICNKIKNVVPESKIIFILRDPIDRAYSHYCNSLRNGKVSNKVDDELGIGSKYIKKGEYSKYISRIRSTFDTEIFIFEKMKESNKEFIQNFYSYIGVKENVSTKWIDNKVNHRKKNVNDMLQNLSFTISNIMGKFEIGKKIIRKVRYTGMLEPFYEAIGSEYPTMTDEKFSKLKEHFQKEVDFINENYYSDVDKYWLNEKPSK